MTGRIFRSTLAASLTVLLASLLVITGCLYSYFGTVQERQLREELSLCPQRRWKRMAMIIWPGSAAPPAA